MLFQPERPVNLKKQSLVNSDRAQHPWVFVNIQTVSAQPISASPPQTELSEQAIRGQPTSTSHPHPPHQSCVWSQCSGSRAQLLLFWGCLVRQICQSALLSSCLAQGLPACTCRSGDVPNLRIQGACGQYPVLHSGEPW